jgi:VIT1/CCC1 family predicted Fe2+/Mn2+ transporter
MGPLDSWHGELTSAYLYRRIAARESEPRRRRLFEQLAREAEEQAGHWAARLRDAGATPGPFAPDLRARIVGGLVDLLGPARLTHSLTAMKVRGMSLYRGGEQLASRHDELGERHASAGTGGSLRAAVFGVNDGLVSNASLILGVAGAGSANAVVLLTGVAGMLAGAFSMAAGEYVSVRSQKEMFEHQIALERAELAEYPEEEAGELALIFEARGMDAAEARRQADALIADPNRALETLTREELGLNPGELGSPWGAALASFAAFAVGSAIPLLPFLAMRAGALPWSIGLSASAQFAVGAATSLFTGNPALHGGLRMLAIGSAAGALTYAIGAALGVSLG